MMRWGALPALVLAIIVGTGCVQTAFVPTTTLRLPSRPEGCYLDVILHGEPPYPYVVIGSVTTDSTAPGLFAIGEGNEIAIERMQSQACRVGAHGLLQIDSQSHGVWTKDGYSKSTTGAAVAFVYVDEAGRPLPPPSASRPVVHPGAYAAPPPPPAAAPSSYPATPPPGYPPPPPPVYPPSQAPGETPVTSP
jgi:hypothetical protein